MFRNTHRTVGQRGVESRESRVESQNRQFGLRCHSGSRPFAPGHLRSGSPRPFRRGISLTEVLIAMGIMTVGLLGVAAVFPVGSYYMQKGDIADRGSAIAQAAFHEAMSRGVLNPENWLTWEDASGAWGATRPGGATDETFLRPYADALRQQKASIAAAGWTVDQSQKYTALEFGSVLLIDPMGVASIALTRPSDGRHIREATYMEYGGVFPSSYSGIPSNPMVPEWRPWGDFATSLGPRWPVRRVTLRQSFPDAPYYMPLNQALADQLFSTSDDLSLDLPAAQDKPSIQRWSVSSVDLNGDTFTNNDPLARQSRGDYSWIITVSPNTAEARDALGTDPSAYPYEVSVVVLYKRTLTAGPRAQSEVRGAVDFLQANERAVRAKVVSTGLSGGEVLLEGRAAEKDTFNALKVGNWLMLCGPHPNSTDQRPMMTARWYQVLAIEGKDIRLDASGNPTTSSAEPERRLVALRGPEWPWQPATNMTYAELSNALYACIPSGAVAVHAKTIRLEGNSVWSGGANSLTTPPPPGRGPGG